MATKNIIADSPPGYVEQNRMPLLSKVLFGGRTIAPAAAPKA